MQEVGRITWLRLSCFIAMQTRFIISKVASTIARYAEVLSSEISMTPFTLHDRMIQQMRMKRKDKMIGWKFGWRRG